MYVSIIRKKTILAAPVIFFFFMTQISQPDSVVFGNPSFGEIKNNSLITTPFQKKFSAIEILGTFLPSVKRYFQWHQGNSFSVGLQ